jgi:hypothetical protein
MALLPALLPLFNSLSAVPVNHATDIIWPSGRGSNTTSGKPPVAADYLFFQVYLQLFIS